MAYTHELLELPYDYNGLDGISSQVVEWHHDVHHAGYVNGRNSVEEKLEEMRENGDFSGIRSVKLDESHNANGQILHEVYWQCMGGDGGEPDGRLADKIEEDFGSFENFKQEFIATAKAARGWALLAFDPSDNRLHVYMHDFHDQHPVVGAIPILACDMWEHAYYYDRGPNKEPYIEAFFNNLHWDRIQERYNRVADLYL